MEEGAEVIFLQILWETFWLRALNRRIFDLSLGLLEAWLSGVCRPKKQQNIG